MLGKERGDINKLPGPLTGRELEKVRSVGKGDGLWGEQDSQGEFSCE